MRYIFSAFLCAIFHSSFSQNPRLPDKFLDDVDIFNREKIAASGFRQALIEYAYKFDEDVIKKEKRTTKLIFDSKGYLISKVEYRGGFQNSDSIVHQYFYSDKGLVEMYVRSDRVYHAITSKEVQKKEYSKLTHRLFKYGVDWSKNWEQGKITWSDSIAQVDGTFLSYNMEGQPYKKVIREMKNDESGKSILEFRIFQPSQKLSTTRTYHYERNAKGNGIANVIGVEVNNLNKFLFDWSKTWTYENDLMIEEVYYKEGEKTHVRKVTYNKDGLPELDLTRNLQSKKMSILEIRYR